MRRTVAWFDLRACGPAAGKRSCYLQLSNATTRIVYAAWRERPSSSGLTLVATYVAITLAFRPGRGLLVFGQAKVLGAALGLRI
jgi:hypothetical protein